jgi:hypothetical protein
MIVVSKLWKMFTSNVEIFVSLLGDYPLRSGLVVGLSEAVVYLGEGEGLYVADFQ